MSPSLSVQEGKARAAFLRHFAKSGIVGHAVEEANADLQRQGVHDYILYRKQVDRWREADEEFNDDCHAAERDAADLLEREAIRRAREGWDEPVFSRARNGEVEEVGTIHKYSDVLLIFTLKGYKPDKYGDKVRLAGSDGGPLQLQPARDVLAERLADLVERRQRRLQAGIASAVDAEIAPNSLAGVEAEPVSVSVVDTLSDPVKNPE